MGRIILIVIGAVVAAALLVALIVLFITRKRGRDGSLRYAQFRERSESAVLGSAVVTGSRGGVSGDGAERVPMTLTLDVTPGEGQPYRTATTWLVDITELGSVKQGSRLDVRIDREDRRIVYPSCDWARYIPR